MIGRRQFITLLGGAAAWPLTARAAAGDANDRVLSKRVARRLCILLTTFRNGLKEAGYIEGRNVAVECPRAEGQLKEGGSPCNIETAHLRWW